MTDKRLIFQLHKQHIKLNIQKTNNSIKKWGEYLNRHFYKEDIEMVKRLNVSNYQKNLNQKHNDISLHTFQKDYDQSV